MPPLTSNGPARWIYVLHPFRGSGTAGERDKNRARIELICREIMGLGHIPLSPVHFAGFLDDTHPHDRAQAFALCQALIGRSDEVWSFTIASRRFDPKACRYLHTSVVSAGCARDLQDAKKAQKSIIYFHYEEGAGAVRDLRLSRGGV